MKLQIIIDVEVEHVSGKFASKDEIADYLINEVEGAAPNDVSGVGSNGDSEYEVMVWEVSS
jgi:hypothetical protein